MRFSRWSLLLVLSLAPRVALADEQSELDRGRNAYLARQYDEADTRFKAMLDPKGGTLHETIFVSQAYMYWGAVMIAKKKPEEAKKLFEQLILKDPRFEPDPLAFPTEVLDAFTDARGHVREKLTEQDRENARRDRERKIREEEIKRREKERLVELERLASEEKIYDRHSRVAAYVPFGVGQFQNGKPTLGWIFLISETVFAAGSLVTIPLYRAERVAADDANQTLNDRFATANAQSHIDNANALQRANWIFVGAFAVATIAGIAEANYNYVPDIVTVKKRPIPPPVSMAPTLTIDRGASVGLAGQF